MRSSEWPSCSSTWPRPGSRLSKIRDSYPSYAIAKHKLPLEDDMDADALLASLAKR